MTPPYESSLTSADPTSIQTLVASTESFLTAIPGESNSYSLSDLSLQHLKTAARMYGLTQQAAGLLERSASHSLLHLVSLLKILCTRRRTELEQISQWLALAVPQTKLKGKNTADLEDCLEQVKELLSGYRLYHHLNQCAAWHAEAGEDWETARKFQSYSERILQDLRFLEAAYRRASNRVKPGLESRN